MLCVFAVAGLSRAADVNINLSLEARDTAVRVTIGNAASAPLRLARVVLELDRRTYPASAAPTIAAGGEAVFPFEVTMPTVPGTYPLIARVSYWNEGQRYSLAHVGEFHVGAPRRRTSSAELSAPFIQKEGTIRLTTSDPEAWSLILPEEIEVLSDTIEASVRTLRVRGRNSAFTNTYPIFAYRQEEVSGGRALQLVQGSLRLDFRSATYPRGRIPPSLLLFWVIGCGIAAFAFQRGAPANGNLGNLLAKYSARLWLLFLGYWFVRELPLLCGLGQDLPGVGRFFDHAKQFALGADYRRFFMPQGFLPLGIADLYVLGVVVLSPLYSHFCDRQTPWREDKYCALVAYLFALPARCLRMFVGTERSPAASKSRHARSSRRSRRGHGQDHDWLESRPVIPWRGAAKLGFLTCCVKVFFIPLLCAWVTQNSQHMANLTRSLQWQWPVINRSLREACIFLDTAVFCIGYLVEAAFLRNKIRSVEPTFLGWIVCLWCYPPFNSVSFRPFTDTSLNVPMKLGWLQGEPWTTIGQALITLSWVIFAWASLALGFRASNLTNRGIVTSGPYRFCRHPAYTVKILGWLIGGLFFAEHGALGLFGLALIYFLRAWTEERHLGLDPDYQAYCKKVRYRFIPGLV